MHAIPRSARTPAFARATVHRGAPRDARVATSTRVSRDDLVAFRERDPDAVRTMNRVFGRLVYAVAHRVLGQHELAEEATQQTFERAWRAADRLDIDRDPASWLATIAKRAAIDLYRREARRPKRALADLPETDPALIASPPDLGTLDAVWRVRRAVDELPDDEAAVVRHQLLDGMTQQEVADRLGVALGTVKSRSHRAHQKLAALLGHLEEPLS